MSKIKQTVYLSTFLSYTSIHALRTSYSFAKSSISQELSISSEWMGLVDCLMLMCLGVGHLVHALTTNTTPVKHASMATIACGCIYLLIGFCRSVGSVCFLMALNGYLQSYTWPNLLMIIHTHFDPNQYALILNVWATNANVGNIIGFAVFDIIEGLGYQGWILGLVITAIYAGINGLYTYFNVPEIKGLTPPISTPSANNLSFSR